MDYKKMYIQLFDATAKAIDLLVEAQRETEKLYMEHSETPLEIKRSNRQKIDDKAI